MPPRDRGRHDLLVGPRRPALIGVFGVLLVGHLVALYWPRVDVGGPVGTDKVGHLVMFGLPAFVGALAVGRWWPVSLLAVHAPVSELVQALALGQRCGDVRDVVADVFGVGLAALAVLVTAYWRRRRAGRLGGLDDPAL